MTSSSTTDTSSRPSSSRIRCMTAEEASRLICLDDSLDSFESEDDEDLDENLLFDNSSDEEYTPHVTKKAKLCPGSSKGKGKGKGKGKLGISSTRPSPAITQSDKPIDRPNISTDTRPIEQEWSEVTSGQTENNFRFHPLKTPGVCPKLQAIEDPNPIEFFNELFDNNVKDYIVDSVNSYAKRKVNLNTPALKRSVFNRWKDMTRHELDKFIAVLIYMGIYKRPSIKDYWAMSAESYVPWIHHVFNRQRFQDIYHSMLHCGEEASEGKDKIEPFMNLLLNKFRDGFYPFEELSSDEMVIGYKGRWQFKQYNASKPSKYHIKTFGLCDSSTGYVVDILTYFGANTSYNPEIDKDGGQAVQVFNTLLQHVGTGHKIFADRYYTTRKLLDYLISKRQYYTGTLNINRVGFPLAVKHLPLQHKEMKWYLNDPKSMLCVAFRDKKAKKNVILVSSDARVATTEMTKMAKPEMIHLYNHKMNGCDKLDQKVTYYCAYDRKTLKWWKKIFFWVLEVTQVNSYILFILCQRDNQNRMSLKDYKLLLMRQLTGNVAMETLIRPPGKGPEIAFLERTSEKQHLVDYDDRDRSCVYCSTATMRIRTHFFCSGCETKPHLHPKGCFKAFHSK